MKENKHLQTINSPNQVAQLEVGIADSTIWYRLSRNDRVLVDKSNLPIYHEDTYLLAVASDVEYAKDSFDETWEQPWGEQRYIRNNYNELALKADSFTVRFRLFDDGLGFRYELDGEGEIDISREETEFNITHKAKAWWIPALGQNHYEHLYKQTSLPDIDTAHTPLTIELPDSGYLAIHEAALYDYGSMNVVPTEDGLMSTITPLLNGNAARVGLPFNTPWRTIIF